jgi:hypothetical protein
MSRQTTDTLLMVRPARFGFNAETAANNAFQTNDQSRSPAAIQREAVQEFDAFAAKLREAGVQVIVAQDSEEPLKPDAVFPNNWVSFHHDGTVVTFPMFSPLRRRERREEVIAQAVEEAGFSTHARVHLENHEAEDRYLEGTGSMILDHDYRIVYACISRRTDAELLAEFASLTGYEPVAFRSVDEQGQDVYHTNVMMALGETFVVICLDSVKDENERAMLTAKFAATNKEIISISLAQMNSFAGNMLQVRNTTGDTFLVMSEQAYKSLTADQIVRIESHTRILHSALYTIETYGGGSARCMLAEVFGSK